MLSNQHSYEDCLSHSIKSEWTVDDCFQDRNFDFSKRFLPYRIAGVDGITCLNDDEKLKLNQILGNSYCHVFAFVEEYIIPLVMDQAREDVYGDETRLRYLLRFAHDETKHQDMLKRAMSQIDEGLGVECGVIPGREDVAEVVLGKSKLAGLLLTSLIEWFTHLHYVEHVRAYDDLDPLFQDILKYHWIDEAQHAKAYSLMILETIKDMSEADRLKAIDELLELGGAIDGLLAHQMELDLEALEKVITRTLSADEKAEIRTHQQRSYRWTFLVSGLEHLKFVEVIEEVAKGGNEKIVATALALAA